MCCDWRAHQARRRPIASASGCGRSRSSSGSTTIPARGRFCSESSELMSTLLIEGGHRLEGRVAVEGNKNAALPLLAACLLTDDECVLTNVPRIGDVEVMARLLLDVGAEVEGIGTTTLRDTRTPTMTDGFARSLAGRPAARVGAAARSAAGAHRPRAHRAARWRLSGAPHDLHAPRSAQGAWARAKRTGPDHVLEAPRRPEGRVDVSLRGVGHRHRDGAARRGISARASPRFATPPPSRTSWSCASSSPRWAPASAGIGSSKIRIEGVPKLHGAQHRLGGDYIEAGSWAVVGAITGGEIAIEGVPRRGHRSGRRGHAADERSVRHA